MFYCSGQCIFPTENNTFVLPLKGLVALNVKDMVLHTFLPIVFFTILLLEQINLLLEQINIETVQVIDIMSLFSKYYENGVLLLN